MKRGFSKISNIQPIISLIMILAIITILFLSFNNFKDNSKSLYADVIEGTVKKYLIQCYAIEGSYPPDLEYLAQNYGLILDHDNYIYHYMPFSSNILPDVKVYYRAKDTEQEQIIF